MQNSTILLFSFTVLNKLKALQLSKVGLLAIKHQRSKKKSDTMDRSHLNQKHMKNSNCLQEFVHKRCSNVHHLHGHMPGEAVCTGQLQCQQCPVRNRTIPQL